MDWKEFLRPKLRHIPMMLGGLVLFAILMFSMMGCAFSGGGEFICKFIIMPLLYILSPFIEFIDYIDRTYPLVNGAELLLLIVVLELAYLYLLSCLLIYLYDKFKNRNLKKKKK